MSRSLIQQTVRKPRETRQEGVAALWHGQVVEVLADGTVWALVPRLGGTDPFGPIRSIPSGLHIGEAVLIGAIEGLLDDLFVLSRTVGGVVPPHQHAAADISDSTPIGRALLAAADAAAARSAIGAGTSNLKLGTTSSTAKPGDYTPAYSDITGTVPNSALPALAIQDTYAVESEAEMLGLIAQRGDIAVRADVKQTFILRGSDPTVLSDWIEFLATGQVVSVAGKTGVVTLDAADTTSGTFSEARIPKIGADHLKVDEVWADGDFVNGARANILTAGAIEPDMLEHGASDNLIKDPLFQDEAIRNARLYQSGDSVEFVDWLSNFPETSWGMRANYSEGNVTVHFGTKAGLYTDLVPVTPGERIYFRVFVSFNDNMQWRWTYAARNYDGSTQYNAIPGWEWLNGATGWRDVVWTVPDSIVAIQMRTQMRGGYGPTDGYLYFQRPYWTKVIGSPAANSVEVSPLGVRSYHAGGQLAMETNATGTRAWDPNGNLFFEVDPEAGTVTMPS